MSHLTVSVTQQEIIVRYKIPKSMKLAERIRSVCAVKHDYAHTLGIINVSLNSEPVLITNWTVSFELSVLHAVTIKTMPSKDMMKLVKFLFRLHNIDPNITDKQHLGCFAALHHACFAGDLEVVDFLLSKGAHPDIGDNDGDTPIMIASFRGDLDLVKILVSKCPSAVQTANLRGLTPLMTASCGGHILI